MESITVRIELEFNSEGKVYVEHEAADGTGASFEKSISGFSAFDRCRKMAVNAIVAWSNYGRVGLWSWANQVDAVAVLGSQPSAENDA